MTATAVDVARNREVKVHALALFAWRHGVAASTLFALTGKQRDAMARAAGVNPPSTGSPTWGIVFGRLEAMAAAADDPRAPARDLAGEDHWWKVVEPVEWPTVVPVPAAAEPADPVVPAQRLEPPATPRAAVNAALASWESAPPAPVSQSAADPVAPRPRLLEPVVLEEPLVEAPVEPPPPVAYDEPGPVPADAPRGWAALAQAYDGDPLPMLCRACGAAAIANTPDGPACRAHPPEWGRALDWTPNPGRACPPRQCSCGRCPHYRPIPRPATYTDHERRSAR